MKNKKYDVVIGLEIHAEINTNSKVFCGCKNSFGSETNTNCCPICVGMPGSLPVLNKKAVEYTIKAGLCFGSEITNLAVFERKNYFYPDLSKAYQISQLVKPICKNGGIELASGKFIRLNRIHLEEDAGKLIHKTKTIGSLVDYNRGGVPLMEIVTEPDLNNAEETVEFLVNLRQTLVYAGVANCKMEEGGMRCDVNLSVKEKGSSDLGTRTEMKNLNSFKMVRRAIEYESKRQIEELEAGCAIIQQTRKWDDNKGKSFSMRTKGDSNDYRYFPDPDLLTVEIDKHSIEEIKKTIPRLAKDRIKTYVKEFGLPEYDAVILTNEKYISDYFEECLKILNEPKDISNWIMTHLLRILKTQQNYNSESLETDLNKIISPKNLTAIIKLLENKKITRVKANELFEIICFSPNLKAEEVAKEKGMLNQFSDEQLQDAANEVLKQYNTALSDYEKTPEKVVKFYIGKIMALSKGSANPQKAEILLDKKIKEILKK